jgi:telomerase reverse transcriptase
MCHLLLRAKLIVPAPLENFEPFHSRLLHSNQSMRNAVLLDQVQITSHYGEQLWQTLHAHLREHLVKVRIHGRIQPRCFPEAAMQIGPEFFKQKTGIPQGSKVSSLLCTLYYGHMERSHLRFINNESSVRPDVT